ncbi:NTP transferase domain-containing protein [uncultured Duncaniella sp.]|uniref:acylneuraminate cytidylyltransferase family protein n=1 Tax=uncultured Duncaniella sp. TaxID=2768039 RepID=UPI0026DED734|nr:NTP transferase domain-containing protein [uncultured Duncaniella sp.]
MIVSNPKQKITAVIPIRRGSQRVKDKILRPFGDTCLMELKISTLMQVPEIDEIIVNTNSEDAIRIVNECYAVGGVKTYRREEYYASSECSGSEFFRNLGEVTDTDVFMYCPCTSPFVKPETISQCIRAYAERGENDCVSTVSQIKEFLWLDGKPLNYDPSNAPNSQDLPDMVALNFGVTVIGRQDLINNRNIIGKNPRFVVTSDIEAIDIDTPLDFYIAEQIYRKTVIEKLELLE